MIKELKNYVVDETGVRLEYDKSNEMATLYYDKKEVLELTGYSTYPLNEQITDLIDLFQAALNGMEEPL